MITCEVCTTIVAVLPLLREHDEAGERDGMVRVQALHDLAKVKAERDQAREALTAARAEIECTGRGYASVKADLTAMREERDRDLDAATRMGYARGEADAREQERKARELLGRWLTETDYTLTYETRVFLASGMPGAPPVTHDCGRQPGLCEQFCVDEPPATPPTSDYCCGAFVIGNCPNHPPARKPEPPSEDHTVACLKRGERTGVCTCAPAESETILRRLLWLRHGCSFAALYGDDGEMQCNAAGCRMDFKRMTAAQIDEAFTQQGLRKLAVSQVPAPAEPSARCICGRVLKPGWTCPCGATAEPKPETRHEFVAGKMPTEPWFWTDSRRCHFLVSPNICCGKPASDPVHESARPTEPCPTVPHVHEVTRDGVVEGEIACPPPDEYAVLDTGGVSEDAVDVAARAGQVETRCACGHTDRQHGLPRMVDNGPLWRACAECRCNEYSATEPQEPGEEA
jgi:hypothetical protein